MASHIPQSKSRRMTCAGLYYLAPSYLSGLLDGHSPLPSSYSSHMAPLPFRTLYLLSFCLKSFPLRHDTFSQRHPPTTVFIIGIICKTTCLPSLTDFPPKPYWVPKYCPFDLLILLIASLPPLKCEFPEAECFWWLLLHPRAHVVFNRCLLNEQIKWMNLRGYCTELISQREEVFTFIETLLSFGHCDHYWGKQETNETVLSSFQVCPPYSEWDPHVKVVYPGSTADGPVG